MATGAPVIPIVLHKCGRLPDRSFATTSEFTTFLDHEAELWNWVSAHHDVLRNPARDRALELLTCHRNTRQSTEKLMRVLSPGQENEASRIIEEIMQRLSAAYSPDHAIHRNEPAGQVMLAMIPHGPAAVGGAFACFSGGTINSDYHAHPMAVLGWTEAMHCRLGIGSAVPDSKRQFESMIADLESERRIYRDKCEADQGVLEKLVSSTTKANQTAFAENLSITTRCGEIEKGYGESLQKLRNDHADELAGAREASKKELDSIRNMYSKGLATKAPVEYWSSRQTKCWQLAAVGTVALGLSGWGFVCALLGAIDVGLRSDQATEGTAMASSAWTPVHAWQVVKVLVISTLGLWGLRLLVRFVLSQVHLALDAGFRVVLTKSYLALIGEKHIEGTEARELVLKALFRPASTGMIRDDAMPPTPTAEIVQRLTNEKSSH